MNLARLYSERICPACGYKLDFQPWAKDESREQICPCCGIHFGLDDEDESRREQAYVLWRHRWISTGRRWWSNGPPPADYNPPWQLARLEQLANKPTEE